MNNILISTPEKVGGGQNTGRPLHFKSRGTCPPVHPWIYAHAWEEGSGGARGFPWGERGLR